MNLTIFSLITLQLLLVSWVDVRSQKISNLWIPVNATFAVVFHFLYPDAYPSEWTVLIFPVAIVVVGFILFTMNVMGAGDSKYLASLFLIIPPDHHMIMLEKVVYSTILVGLVMLVLKIGRDFSKIRAYALSTHWKGLKETIRSRFSYAPVILLAWLWIGAQNWL